MFEVGHVLVGSQNYVLNGSESDKDYKVLMCPDFDDLYLRKRVEKTDLPDEYKAESEHYSVMDVRTFDKNVREGNFNTLEMLFSTEQNNFYLCTSYYFSAARKLYQDGYLVMVFPQFLRTVKGLIFNSFDRYEVNRKTASRALYFCNFVEYAAANNFKVDYITWRNKVVSISAREMRFNETILLPTRQKFEERFSCLETETLKTAAETFKNLTAVQVNDFNIRQEALYKEMKHFVIIMLKE